MMQGRTATGNIKVLAAIFMVVAMVGVFIFANPYAAEATNGAVTVTFPNWNDNFATNTNELEARIAFAEGLINETEISATGGGLPNTTWWATQTAHNTLNAAIVTARDFLSRVGRYSRGDEFQITVGFASTSTNTEFGAMMFRLNIPAGLEVIGVTPNPTIPPASFTSLEVSPTSPRTGLFTAGWAGANTNIITTNFRNNLLTYTFRVASNAPLGLTPAMTITFGSEQTAHETPTRIVTGTPNTNQALTMSINGTPLAPGHSTNVTLGRVLVR